MEPSELKTIAEIKALRIIILKDQSFPTKHFSYGYYMSQILKILGLIFVPS